MSIAVLVVAIVLAACSAVAAQTADEPARVVFGDVGYARTWDDEGFLGSGTALTAGVGFRLTGRLNVQAIVERVPYYRDVEYLTFDGRAIFVMAEVAFQSSRPRVRPFASAGAGIMHDERVWISKTIVDPGSPRVFETAELQYTLAAMTASGGLDVRVSRRTSLRAGVRVHGLLDTGDDLAPHLILQPAIGVALRW